MQEWLETEASDGFNVMFHTVPSGLHEFVDLVVPELQKRGLFRREYQGTTLREHLGLPRPENRVLSAPQSVKGGLRVAATWSRAGGRLDLPPRSSAPATGLFGTPPRVGRSGGDGTSYGSAKR
jgi:hypothetical protein